MSKKLVLLTIFYFGSYGICLPQNCPCSKSQYSYSGPPQLVLARPWSGYNAHSPTYLPFPLVISRGTRAIKSALESPKEADKKLKTDLVDLEEDKNSKAQNNIKPKAATPPRRRIKITNIDDRSSNSEEKVAEKNKAETEESLSEEVEEEEKEEEKEEEEEEESSDDQREIDTLNLLGQLFQVLALQYQKVFGEQNNLNATNSSSVKSDVDDEEQEDYGDYSYDSVPTQIDTPETEQKIAKKEKRKAEVQIKEKEKVTNKVQRINYNGTTTAKPSD
ncbi:GSCOCG00009153001-RA-CDS [Cotesia congregata]|nr:GSCOCG00009153001-RA-CDS [Cotesia congregata]